MILSARSHQSATSIYKVQQTSPICYAGVTLQVGNLNSGDGSVWGARGPGFKSRRSDQAISDLQIPGPDNSL